MRTERVCNALATLGCIWFAFTAWLGVGAVPHGGHIGAGSAAIAMAAEASIRWHTVYPLYDWYVRVDPMPQSAYCHHPFGSFWVTRILLGIFGHRDFVPNLPAAIMSSLTPPLLYKIARQAWGPIAGVGAVAGFVLLPITVGFSVFHNLEVMTMFGGVLFFFGHTRYQKSGRSRDLVLSLLGALITTSGDWVGYLIMAPLLAVALFRAWILPSWATPVLKTARYHRWWALSVTVAVGTLLLWVALFKHVDKLADWLASAESRGGGAGDVHTLEKTLEARASWIDFSFTPLAILLGKLAVPIAVVRWLVRRTDEEMYSLAMLFAASVQYLAFRQGAEVHIFWPQYFGAYYAFAFAQLVATAEEGVRWTWTRIDAPRAAAGARIAAFVTLGVPTLLIGPDAVRSLKIWRETGGRYDDKGTLIRSHVDMLAVVAQVIKPNIHNEEHIGVHSSANWGWEHQWVLAAQADNADAPSGSHPFWVARASGLGGDRIKALASSQHIRIYGDTIVVATGDREQPVDAYSLHETEPNILQRMFTNDNEPVRTITNEPDAFRTWEWRVHLEQPAAQPTAQPADIDELRIAHNVAVTNGDADLAERLRERLVAQLDRQAETHFDGGAELIGVLVTSGVQRRLRVFIEATGPTKGDAYFQIRSHVVMKSPTSLIGADPTDREMAYPPPLSMKLWRKGFIYAIDCVMNHRIGLEAYYGNWAGGPARRGVGPIELAVLK